MRQPPRAAVARNRDTLPVASANLDLVRSICTDFEHGDFTRAPEWAHPEMELVIADGPSPGSWRGVAGLAEATYDFLPAWKDLSGQAREFRELDDERVLVVFHMSGRGKASGLKLEQTWAKVAGLFHVRDGKVTRGVFYFDHERALADIGLPSEADSPRS